MKYLSSKEIRNLFLNFFQKLNHKVEKSASLVPVNDKSLLWINSGVAAIKDFFDGTKKPSSKRIVNIQKCIRTNDIDNVGLTSRHHTFFEMLGNFSIGDYFKDQAIEYAFELLTSKDFFDINKNKLFMTYHPSDQSTLNKWKSLGIDENHLIPLEANFWEIGSGPCGPDTEIFFDRGPAFDSRGIELIINEIDNERYVEIWNIVFSQFNSTEGLERKNYPELPQKNIDTGAGLERWASIFQNTKTNFETDLFLPIINKIEKISGIKYNYQEQFRVIADHIKTIVFAISDGVVLSNEGRGYVLRRLLRRAVKKGIELNLKEPFLYELVSSVINLMKDEYPKLLLSDKIVRKVIKMEEEKFFKTIFEGEKLLNNELKNTSEVLSGSIAFRLYDTYGFPIELTEEYSKEKNIRIDKEEFQRCMEIQRKRSRDSIKRVDSMSDQDQNYLSFKSKSEFIGYDFMKSDSKIIGIFEKGVVLDKTPFYASSGGQKADFGSIQGFDVENVIKLPNNQHLHMISNHNLKLNDKVYAEVDELKRDSVSRNHSAAHLFHQAIRELLGDHSSQKGQQVSENSWRFDFNHYENLSEKQIIQIENLVNHHIKINPHTVDIYETSLEEAINAGALANFGDKYGDVVRVVDMGWSIELCGGTHVQKTQDIKNFCISSYSSIGSGIYRMEGVTGDHINQKNSGYLSSYFVEIKKLRKKISDKNYNISLKEPDIIGSYLDIINLRSYIKEIQNKIKIEDKKSLEISNDWISETIELNKIDKSKKSQVIKIIDLPKNMIRNVNDKIFEKLNLNECILVIKNQDNIYYSVKSRIDTARDWIQRLNIYFSGSGGGNSKFCQGGSKINADRIKKYEEFDL